MGKKKPANTDVYRLSSTPRVGLEPTTPRLTAVCSTIELSRIIRFPFLPYLPWKPTERTPAESSLLVLSFPAPSKLHTASRPSSNLLRSSLRPISICQLNMLPCLHPRPIYLVVFKGSYSLLWGISHLEGGFTLRCLQRLSRPGLATRLCTWQYNRYTSGQSTPVLSY